MPYHNEEEQKGDCVSLELGALQIQTVFIFPMRHKPVRRSFCTYLYGFSRKNRDDDHREVMKKKSRLEENASGRRLEFEHAPIGSRRLRVDLRGIFCIRTVWDAGD